MKTFHGIPEVLIFSCLALASGASRAQQPTTTAAGGKTSAATTPAPAKQNAATPTNKPTTTSGITQATTGASTADKSVPDQTQVVTAPAEPTSSPAGVSATATPYVDPGYVIGAQDILEISVWKEADFSRAVPVRPDGKITLPLLNDVQAAGLTPVQLAANLTKLLTKYITDPQVTVIVDRINSRMIFMSGEINRPGAIPLLMNMTVLQAISMAGGPNQFGNPKKIYVLRTENGKQVRYPFNYKDAIKGKGFKENILLKPGDTIVVP